MSEKKRFHPIALITYFMTTLKGLIYLIILAFINIASSALVSLATVFVIILICLISALVRYFTRTYSINDDKIVIYSGIFVKKETEIPYERIQTIKQRQWFFYKPFNIVQILIETGSTSDAKAEASLLAVDASLIDLIEDYRYKRKKNITTEVESTSDLPMDSNDLSYEYAEENNLEGEEALEDEEIIYEYKLSFKEIILYAITDLNIIATTIPILLIIISFVLENSFLLDKVPDGVYTGIDAFLAKGTFFVIIIIVVFSIILLMIISVVKSFFYYFEFTVTCSRKTITIEYGVFERKTQKIPLNKVQGIKIYQQAVRKLLTMSSVEIVLIGGQENKGENTLEKKVLVLPLINTKHMYEALQKIFPTYTFEEPEINYLSRNKLFYFWRWTVLFMLPITIVCFYFFTFIGMIPLVLSIIFLFFNWLDCRYQGYAIMDENLIAIQNFSGVSKVQTLVDRSKIQSFDKHSTLLLFRKNIGHFMFWIKSGMTPMSVGLKFVDLKDINNVQSFLTKSVAYNFKINKS